MNRCFLAALLALCAIDANAAPDFSFSRPVRLTTEFFPHGSVAIGDANGDGRMDLAVTRDSDGVQPNNVLSLYLQRADGTLAAPLTLRLPAAYGEDVPVRFVDLDHDGTQEIFVGQGNTQVVVARLSAGVLTQASTPSLKGCAYIATGDIDGDGNQDVACHDEQVTATIFFGDGTGGFRNSLQEQTPAGTWYTSYEAKSIQLADMNGDGRLDLLLTSSGVNSFFVLENDGMGGFWPGAVAYAHPYTPLGVYPSTLQVVDVDGDGVDEVVTVSPDNRPNAYINVYRRRANGYLGLSDRIPTYDSTTALLAADLDGDNDKELLEGHFEMHAVSVVGANGGGLDAQSRFDLPGFGNPAYDWHAELVASSNGFALGDINGDGCPDLAATTFSGTTLLFGCEPYISKIPVSDFDGDGFSDVLWRWDERSGVLYAYFRGSTVCTISTCPPTIEPYQQAQALGDFDGDGNTDVFWRNPSSGQNLLMLAAIYERLLPTTSTAWSVVGAGDFDGDDQSDLLWRNAVSGVNTIWRSADSTTQMSIAQVGNLAWKVAGVGDFDGDGRSDVLWRNSTTGANTIWRSGNNLTQQAMTGVTGKAWKIVGIGDFDADGRDDVAWRNTTTGANTIWLSANNATQRAVAGVSNQQWAIEAIGDYNADGAADLFWRNATTDANTIWLSANNRTQQAVGPTFWAVASP
jgi:hypothetical protein